MLRSLAVVAILTPALSGAQAVHEVVHGFALPAGFPPYGSLILGTDGALRGTTANGGARGVGTIFKVNTDGTGFVNLHEFDGTNGANPDTALLGADGVLYGMTFFGGTSDKGVVFKINEDGTGFTRLHDFDGTNGSGSLAAPLVSGGVLYGGANGGSLNYGLLFKMNLDGTGFTKLHEFDGTDGAAPYGGLLASGGALYGTAFSGGASAKGVVFRINEDGTGFAKLHEFDGTDGAHPFGQLVESGSVLYGTSRLGGASGGGVVFKINPDGSGFAKLHDFDFTNGAQPYAGLADSGGTFYGTTALGGATAKGVVFKINPDGSGFTKLHDFDGAQGASPFAGVLPSAGVLYGTTSSGGVATNGTVFSLNEDGTGFALLKDFATGVSGAKPVATLFGSEGVLFGTASEGGAFAKGVLFSVRADGTLFTKLHDFDGPNGATPYGELVASGVALYGTTSSGGASGNGVVFKISEDGTGFTKLHDFDGTTGATPYAALVASDGILYGTTYRGGASDNGVVFKINEDGTGFTKLLDFDGTNGAAPYAGLLATGGVLYGSTYSGGASGKGVLFRINEDGTAFTKLHDFDGTKGSGPLGAPLLSDNGLLYGTTYQGGASGNGVVFKINGDGTGFTKFHDFSGSDGAVPYGSLVERAGVLYGTTALGGASWTGTPSGGGVAFRINKDGTGFTTFHDFTDASGNRPYSGLVEAGGALYGTTVWGGPKRGGVVFRFPFPPTVVNPTSTSVTSSTATLGGDVTSDGGATITERGVVYSVSSMNADPRIGGPGVIRLSTSGTTGDFTVDVTSLLPGTEYSFKAYAISHVDAAYTSPAATFTTRSGIQFKKHVFIAVTPGTSATLGVTRAGQISTAATVDYATSDGTATAGVDYVAKTGQLSFAPGVATKTFSVSLLPKTNYEGDKAFVVALSNPQPSGVELGLRQTAVVTIEDRHPVPTVQFHSAYTTREQAGQVRIGVSRSGPTGLPVTVNYATVDGTAAAPDDYASTAGTLSFGAGVIRQTFAVAIVDDEAPESTENLGLVLLSPGGGAILGARSVTKVSVTDSDPAVQFSAATYTRSEASPRAVITVKRTGSTSGMLTVNYASGEGTARAGIDYQAVSGTLTFRPGVVTQDFAVPIINDTLGEGSETVPLVLSNPNPDGALGSPSAAALTILDSEPVVQFSSATYTAPEPTGSQIGRVLVTVRRVGGTTGTVHVDYASAPGTGSPGADYEETAGQLTFGPGVASRTFTVPIMGDAVDKANPTVNLALTPVDIPLGTPSVAVLTLKDDDLAGETQLAATAFSAPASGGLVAIAVTRRGGTAGPASVQYTTSDGTAIAGTDYTSAVGTITFYPGEMTSVFTVPVVHTGLPTKCFFVELGATTGNLRLGPTTRAPVWIVE